MEEKIRKWLETQGYPLEMRVAREFQSRGFWVRQAEYYTDPDSGTSRETDVIAHVQEEMHGVLTRVSFVVECKTSPDKPWVLFTSPARLADPARVVQRAASGLGHRLLYAVAKRKDVHGLPIFSVHERAAYGMTQAFTTGADKTYEAATSVSKSAAASVAEADNYSKKTRLKVCEFAFPVIALSAELVEAYLAENGEIRVERVGSGTLLWRNPLVGMPHTIIRVLAEQEVPSFAAEAYSGARTFLEIAKNELRSVLTAHR